MSSITLATIFSNGITITAVFAVIMVAVFGLTGVYLAFRAGISLAAGARRNQTGVAPTAWISYAIGAAVCFAVPEAAGVSWTGIFSTATPMQQIGAQASGVVQPVDCLASSSSGANPMACVVNNLAVGVMPVLDVFMFGVAALCGFWMIFRFIRAVIDRAAYVQNAQPIPWGNLIVGVMFLGVGGIIYIFASSLGIASNLIGPSGTAAASAYLAYVPNTTGMTPQYAEMIAGGYVILASVGIYEVIHGGFILVGAMNPSTTQYGMGGKAAVHIAFGAALVALPVVVNAFAYSAMGTGVL